MAACASDGECCRNRDRNANAPGGLQSNNPNDSLMGLLIPNVSGGRLDIGHRRRGSRPCRTDGCNRRVDADAGLPVPGGAGAGTGAVGSCLGETLVGAVVGHWPLLGHHELVSLRKPVCSETRH